MRILSIETSCDDTGISVLECSGAITAANFKVLADNTSSQIKVHQPFGGVYPMLAKREHIKNLPIVLEKTLREAKLKKVDAIAATYGPGLEPSLWTGITFAKELAEKWKIPLIPVNHMEGHVLSVFGKDSGKFKIALTKNKFPMLALLVSGGHTQLVLSKSPLKYEIIGETLDDAVGEAFDKVARMLDLPYPGGPQISKLADQARNVQHPMLHISLPRPMLKSKDFNFSFSGLKTAVLYLIRKISKLDQKAKQEIALEFENAAIECLVHKTARALEKYKIKTLIVAGGVAANKYLKSEMQKIVRQDLTTTTPSPSSTRRGGPKLHFPTQYLSGDNALMIGIAGYMNFIKTKKHVPRPATIKATGNLKL